MSHVELLSPAGSKESLYYALKAGADAVYMGGELFGARAYAKNPDNNEILDLMNYTHILGKIFSGIFCSSAHSNNSSQSQSSSPFTSESF